MKRFVVVVLAVAVATVFVMPAMAEDCNCPKPCNTCVKQAPCPKQVCKPCPTPCGPCVTCGQPDNILQSSADAINSMEAPSMPCPTPCARPCPKPCAQPCQASCYTSNITWGKDTCDKPCPTPCARPCPKPCVTCPACPDSLFQKASDWINGRCEPCVDPIPCPKPQPAPCVSQRPCAKPCSTPCVTPCAKPCPTTCARPCNTCNK